MKCSTVERSRARGLKPDADIIRQAISLLIPPGEVFEVRAPKFNGRKNTASGFFDDPVAATAAITKLAMTAGTPGIYLTLNPVHSDLLARRANRIEPFADQLTTDPDITRRTRLLVDFDPIRKAGISSTEAEHTAALDRAAECREWLGSQGWPDPLYASSGNGAHLVYGIDLPNDADSLQLVQQCLQALAARYGGDGIDLDTTVANASRISKLYGTLTRKGDSTKTRPHRLSRILEAPDRLEPVPVKLLRQLASEAPKPEPAKPPAGNPVSVAGNPAAGDGYFARVNENALSHLAGWVPALFGEKARAYKDGYRVPSADLGRDLEEDLALMPAGIRDFGTERGHTAIDIVLEFGSASSPKEAAHWLCQQIGIDPETLGWRTNRKSPTRSAPPPVDPGYLDSLAEDDRDIQRIRQLGEQCGWSAEHAEADIDADEDFLTPPPRPTEAMFHGLVGDIAAAAADGTEVNRVAAAAGFMSWLSARIGRDVYITLGDIRHHIRLYTLHIGRSMIAGKGESLGLIRRIERHINERERDEQGYPPVHGLLGQSHDAGLSSREGLALFVHDGYRAGKEDVPAIEDKRLWICESEFVNVLHQSQRDGNTLSSALRDAWDGIGIRPATKSNRIWASRPHIALHGCITPYELREALTARDMTNGFGNRFLMIWAERTGLVPIPKGRTEEEVDALAGRVESVVKFAVGDYPRVQDTRPMCLSDAAEQRYRAAYPALKQRESAGEHVSALLERRAPMVIRMAGLFALCDQTLTIGEQHLECALAWADYHRDSVRFVWGTEIEQRKRALTANRNASRILEYRAVLHWTRTSLQS